LKRLLGISREKKDEWFCLKNGQKKITLSQDDRKKE
jgi:hypothetical protein